MTANIDAFLTYYESAHQHSANRYIHHLAHTVAGFGIAYIPWHLVYTVVLIATAFALSWTGHYLFERNAPAFFDSADNPSTGSSFIHKIQVALGGLLWSGACFLRLFNVGPLSQ